ncbi:MAG: hypothetical protein BWK80_17790 [Desulfobacteraceae bacterium IS3]|nr:MAG: hypothetical protein BWK80_17790 [Desulfobacteraceae bacterium IS3]
MNILNMLQDVQFVIDAEGNKKAVQLNLSLWEEILSFIENHEEDATEELLNIQGLVEATEQSRQRMKSGQFVRYEDIKRNV